MQRNIFFIYVLPAKNVIWLNSSLKNCQMQFSSYQLRVSTNLRLKFYLLCNGSDDFYGIIKDGLRVNAFLV